MGAGFAIFAFSGFDSIVQLTPTNFAKLMPTSIISKPPQTLLTAHCSQHCSLMILPKRDLATMTRYLGCYRE